MGGGPYLIVLFVGAAIVVVDGQLILRNAPLYLADAFGEPRRARQVTGLVVMFFHLVMLGVVALVASIGLSRSDIPSLVTRTGVLLLLTAVGHGVTLMILSRLSRQEVATELAEAQLEAARDGAVRQPAPDAAPQAASAPSQEAEPPARPGRLVGRDGRPGRLPATADVPEPTAANGAPRTPPTAADEL